MRATMLESVGLVNAMAVQTQELATEAMAGSGRPTTLYSLSTAPEEPGIISYRVGLNAEFRRYTGVDGAPLMRVAEEDFAGPDAEDQLDARIAEINASGEPGGLMLMIPFRRR